MLFRCELLGLAYFPNRLSVLAETQVSRACSSTQDKPFFLGKSYGEEDFALSAGTNVVLTGTRLKVVGDDSGVFLAPVDDRGNPVADESQWLKSGRIAHNTPGTLDFFFA